MFRYIALTSTLALGLLASACTPGSLTSTDIASLTAAAAATAPTLPATANVTAALEAAGVTPAAQAEVSTNIAKVQQAAAKLCAFRPLASGILNFAIAASSSVATVANSGLGQGVRGAATIICNGLTTAPTYTALRDRRGELVTAYISVGAYDRVPVYGIRTR